MQCDVHANPDDAGGEIPYLLDVQVDLLADLDTRVVVPLIRPQAFGRTVTRLHPVFTVDGQRVVMGTHLIAAVHRRSLGAIVASLMEERGTIIAAIDVLWSGV